MLPAELDLLWPWLTTVAHGLKGTPSHLKDWCAVPTASMETGTFSGDWDQHVTMTTNLNLGNGWTTAWTDRVFHWVSKDSGLIPFHGLSWSTCELRIFAQPWVEDWMSDHNLHHDLSQLFGCPAMLQGIVVLCNLDHFDKAWLGWRLTGGQKCLLMVRWLIRVKNGWWLRMVDKDSCLFYALK